MERKTLGPSPLRELATSPPQADHVLVVLFFIHGGLGGCIKAPRHPPTTPPKRSHPHLLTLIPPPLVLSICPLKLFLKTSLPFPPIIPSHLPSGYCHTVLDFNVSGYILFALLYLRRKQKK